MSPTNRASPHHKGSHQPGARASGPKGHCRKEAATTAATPLNWVLPSPSFAMLAPFIVIGLQSRVLGGKAGFGCPLVNNAAQHVGSTRATTGDSVAWPCTPSTSMVNLPPTQADFTGIVAIWTTAPQPKHKIAVIQHGKSRTAASSVHGASLQTSQATLEDAAAGLFPHDILHLRTWPLARRTKARHLMPAITSPVVFWHCKGLPFGAGAHAGCRWAFPEPVF